MNRITILAKAITASSFLSLIACSGDQKVASDPQIEITHGDVTLSPGYVKQPAKGAFATAGYLELTSAKGDRLLSAASPDAGIIEIHTMTMEEGVMRMRKLPDLELPAGQSVALAPGGDHLMIMQPSDALQTAAMFEVTLTFEKAGEVTLNLPLRQPE